MLKKCPDCGHDLSTRAKTCPYCGGINPYYAIYKRDYQARTDTYKTHKLGFLNDLNFCIGMLIFDLIVVALTYYFNGDSVAKYGIGVVLVMVVFAFWVLVLFCAGGFVTLIGVPIITVFVAGGIHDKYPLVITILTAIIWFLPLVVCLLWPIIKIGTTIYHYVMMKKVKFYETDEGVDAYEGER